MPVLVHNYKSDTKQVKQAARAAGLNTEEMKEAFQREIEDLKHSSGKRGDDNFSFKRLVAEKSLNMIQMIRRVHTFIPMLQILSVGSRTNLVNMTIIFINFN